jgi:hypothetical protein
MTIKQLWQKACEHDGITPDSKFVVFSDANPWAKKYNFAMRCVMLSRQQRGGTVGTLDNLS